VAHLVGATDRLDGRHPHRRAVVSGALGDWKDAIAVLAIIVLNAALGFSQEFRAEKAMVALKKLAVPTVKVRRDGQMREISARELEQVKALLQEQNAGLEQRIHERTNELAQATREA
jgi:hypothetical protein